MGPLVRDLAGCMQQGKQMITIDGTFGEGGGQVLRTALSLAALTGSPFRIEKIRGKRRNPGLRQQPLTCVHAAAAICEARVEGDETGSGELLFRPTYKAPQGLKLWELVGLCGK